MGHRPRQGRLDPDRRREAEGDRRAQAGARRRDSHPRHDEAEARPHDQEGGLRLARRLRRPSRPNLRGIRGPRGPPPQGEEQLRRGRPPSRRHV